jgi:hypothetical protein
VNLSALSVVNFSMEGTKSLHKADKPLSDHPTHQRVGIAALACFNVTGIALFIACMTVCFYAEIVPMMALLQV